MRHRVWLVALSAVLAADAGAQGLEALAVSVNANHYLLGEPLTGLGIVVPFRSGNRETLRLGLFDVNGASKRTGFVCAGLIADASQCPVQPIEDRGRLRMLLLGYEVRVLGSPRLNIGLVGDVSVATLWSNSRGTSNGQTLEARQTFKGAEGGLRANARMAHLPIAAYFEAALGALDPNFSDLVVDGYTPFDRGFHTSRLTAGMSWTPH